MAVTTPTALRTFSRRSFLTISAAAAGLALAGGALGQQGRPATRHTVRAERILMGTRIHLSVVGPKASAAHAVEATFAAMERLIALFDHRQPATALSLLNRSGSIEGAPASFVELMRRAVAFGDATGGAFDVTVKPLLDALRAGAPARDWAELRARVDYRQIEIAGDRVRLAIPGAAVTLDGIAKGRIIDEGTATLRALGFDQVLVEAGGDLRTLGMRSDDTPWRVGIANPRQPEGPVLATLQMRGQAAATSGDYMNHLSPDFVMHHILDPHTGRSPLDLASATVVAPTALDADALATALMVLGSSAGIALAESLPDTEAFLVTKQLATLQTSGALLS